MSPAIAPGKITRPKTLWFSILRIAIGTVLIWKALNFALDTAVFESLQGHEVAGGSAKDEAVLILIFSVITLVCGFLITIGRFTGIASLVQLPVFLLGMLFIHGGHVEREGFELFLTLIIPFVLLIFVSKENYGLKRLHNKRQFPGWFGNKLGFFT